MVPAVVEVNIIGSRLGPIDDSTTFTSAPMSDFSLTYAALPNSSAQHSWANNPSFVLPPALSAHSCAERICPGFQFVVVAVKRMRRPCESI